MICSPNHFSLSASTPLTLSAGCPPGVGGCEEYVRANPLGSYDSVDEILGAQVGQTLVWSWSGSWSLGTMRGMGFSGWRKSRSP